MPRLAEYKFALGNELCDQEEIVSKSMGSYQLFAWRDAMSLASWLEDEYDLQAVRRAFDAMTQGATGRLREAERTTDRGTDPSARDQTPGLGQSSMQGCR